MENNNIMQEKPISHIALQQSEDNKREITYIYSKLKQINNQIDSLNSQGGNSADLTQINADIANIQSELDEIEQYLQSLSLSNIQCENDIITLQNSVTQCSNNIAALQNIIQNLSSNSQSSASNFGGYCTVRTGAFSYFKPSSSTSVIIRPISFKLEEDAYVVFNFEFMIGRPNTNVCEFTVLAYENNNEFFRDNFTLDNMQSTTKGSKLCFSCGCYLKGGNNTIMLKTKQTLSTNNLYYLQQIFLQISSNTKITLQTDIGQFYSITDGNSIYLTHNGNIGYTHKFDNITDLINYDIVTDKINNRIASSNYYNTMETRLLPVLNTDTQQMEKLTPYYVITDNSNNSVKYGSKTFYTYETQGNYPPLMCGEYIKDNVGYMCLMCVSPSFSTVRLFYCNPESASSFSSFRIFGSLYSKIKSAVFIDNISTLDNTPLSNPQAIWHNINGETLFISIDTTGVTPNLTENNVIKICEDGIVFSHTYYYNNKYYMFYKKNNQIYRKIFTYANNTIQIETDSYFESCDDLLVVSPIYITKIKNAIPYTVQKDFTQ